MCFKLLLKILYRRVKSELVLDKEFFRKCEGNVDMELENIKDREVLSPSDRG